MAAKKIRKRININDRSSFDPHLHDHEVSTVRFDLNESIWVEIAETLTGQFFLRLKSGRGRSLVVNPIAYNEINISVKDMADQPTVYLTFQEQKKKQKKK